MRRGQELIANELEARLRQVGTPERATGEKAHLKSDLEFLGATLGQIRAAVRELSRDHADLGHDAVIALVEALWAKPLFERRMPATLVLERHQRLLSRDDLP